MTTARLLPVRAKAGQDSQGTGGMTMVRRLPAKVARAASPILATKVAHSVAADLEVGFLVLVARCQLGQVSAAVVASAAP